MKHVLRSIIYFWPDRRLIAALLCLIGASVLLNLLHAWPMAIMVDTVLAKQPESNWAHRLFLAPFGDDKVAQIAGMTVLGMSIKILQDLVMLARVMVNNRLRLHGTARVKGELFRKLEGLSLGWHRSRAQGDTIFRLGVDTQGPWGVLDTLIGSGAAAVTLTGMTVVMLSRSAPLALFALSITPFLVLANRYFGERIHERAAAAKAAEAGFTTTAQRAMTTIGLIQAFGRETSEAKRFDDSTIKSVDASMKLAWQESLYPVAVQVIFAFGGAVIFGYGGYLAYRDQFLHPVDGGVTPGDLMVFMAYLGQLWDPLGWVLGFTTKIQPHVASCERLFEVLDESSVIVESPDALPLPVRPRTLEFTAVTFGYPERPPVLREVDFAIAPGEMVAFVGPSGAGKSTLLNLLPRFYDPREGEVSLDGCDIRSLRISDVRRHLAIVGQDALLFHGTVAENLRYARPDAAHEELVEAVHEAGAADVIATLPDGFDSAISEGGQNLSGGQRQRLGIARALLSNSPILVLDEPTSALDPEHERWVIETLRSLKGRRTIVLVTHRLESVADCDQIFVLEGGRIAERGSHLQLLARRGAYAKMVSQSKQAANESEPMVKAG